MKSLGKILLILLCLSWCSACTDAYYEHYIAESGISLQVPSSGVSGTAVAPVVSTLPDKTTESLLIEKIKNTKKRAWLEIYTFTHKDIASAYIDAYRRGVDVRIILERNVYGTPTINLPVSKMLIDAGIPVAYADNDRYTFTHAKFGIFDDEFFISTGNFTKSFFKNREYIVFSSDQAEIHVLEALFLADFSHETFVPKNLPASLVIAPIDARTKITALLSHAKKSVQLYIQTLDDDELLNLLSALQSRGIDISICTADIEGNQLRSSGTTLPWKYQKKPYLHAKVIIVDDQMIMIGSQNFSTNALDNNREMSIVLEQTGALLDSIKKNIESGCKTF